MKKRWLRLLLVTARSYCGGAYQTMRYAEKEGKPFINLAEESWR